MIWDDLFFYKDGHLYRNRHINKKYPLGEKVGHLNTEGYIVVWVGNKRVRAHRIIYELHFGAIPTNFEIDHIDRNRSNNSIDNLRVVDRSANSFNRSKRSDNTTGFTGVTYDKKNKKFVAQIQLKGSTQRIGQYDTAEEASCSYERYKESICDSINRW